MDDVTSFGSWVRRRRKTLDLTQEVLATRVAVSVAMIRRLEADERRPSREVAERLAQVLEVPPGERDAFVRTARAEQAVDRLPLAATSTRSSPVIAAREPRAAPPHNLPPQATPFIGRTRDVVLVRQRLMHPDVRLLTLSGPGGAGKTRLALQVAATVRNHFVDGVWVVDLAPTNDPALVPATIATTLGIKDTGGQSFVDALMLYYREKHVLLLLDNFEHVLAAAQSIADVLKAAPHVKLLITSRVPLHLYGEHEYPVPPLALPDPADLPPLAELASVDAVALFIQCAQAVRPDFSLTAENAYHVAALCTRLDGLPLAIELAAMRAKFFTPQALVARLDNRLKLLTGGARDAAARQQTLRATIDWSFNLLAPAEQRLFTRLGVFVGGCTVEAVEAVCDGRGDLGSDVLEGLLSLIDKSLLQQTAGRHGEPRFTMLETIREYALERLSTVGEAATLHQQHADYFLAFAEDAEPHLDRLEQALWLERLAAEEDNLRAALAWSRSAPGNPKLEARLALTLRVYLLARGRFTEAHLLVTMMPHQFDDISARSKALVEVGHTAAFRGELAQARTVLEEGLALAQAAQNPQVIANALFNLGRAAGFAGEYERAQVLLEESLTMFREQGRLWSSAWALGFLADAMQNQGHLSRATDYFMEAYRILQALKNADGAAWAAFTLGRATYGAREYERSQAWFDEALVAFRQIKSTNGSAETLCWIAMVAFARGDAEQAGRSYRESLTLFRRTAVRIHDALVLEGMAGLAGAQGRPARAARLFGAAHAVRTGLGTPVLPIVRDVYDRDVARARAQMDTMTWEAAWAEGRAMTLEQAIAYALEDSPTAE